jgi:molybdate/tungstate transport system permease protein
MKHSWFYLLSAVLGSLLLVFVLLPLAGMLFSPPPASLAQALGDPEVVQSITLTFGASLLATFLTVLGGVPLAYLLARRRFPLRRAVESIIDLPVVIPHTTAGIALLVVFGSQGLLGKPLAVVGINFVDSLAGITTAMAFVSLPYLVSLSRQAFSAVSTELEQAAFVDGASPFQVFWRVSLPLARRGVIGGILMMWARGISEFGAVVILAYHPKIVPVLVFELFQGFGLSAAQPVAVILVIVVLILFILLRTLLAPREDEN